MTTKHEAKPRVRGKPKRVPVKCVVPNCSGLFPTPDEVGTGARGLCYDCYKKAHQLVKRGFTTWDELEYLGLAEPKYGSIMERAILIARKQKKAEEDSVKTEQEKHQAVAAFDRIATEEAAKQVCNQTPAKEEKP